MMRNKKNFSNEVMDKRNEHRSMAFDTIGMHVGDFVLYTLLQYTYCYNRYECMETFYMLETYMNIYTGQLTWALSCESVDVLVSLLDLPP